jgi:hypothetical protein
VIRPDNVVPLDGTVVVVVVVGTVVVVVVVDGVVVVVVVVVDGRVVDVVVVVDGGVVGVGVAHRRGNQMQYQGAALADGVHNTNPTATTIAVNAASNRALLTA